MATKYLIFSLHFKSLWSHTRWSDSTVVKYDGCKVYQAPKIMTTASSPVTGVKHYTIFLQLELNIFMISNFKRWENFHLQAFHVTQWRLYMHAYLFCWRPCLQRGFHVEATYLQGGMEAEDEEIMCHHINSHKKKKSHGNWTAGLNGYYYLPEDTHVKWISSTLITEDDTYSTQSRRLS